MRTTWLLIALCMATFGWALASPKLSGEAKPPPPCVDCYEPSPDAGGEDASSDAGNHEVAATDASSLQAGDATIVVPSSDSGTSATAGTGSSSSSGCSCDVVGRQPVRAPWGSGLALLACLRLRRRARGRGRPSDRHVAGGA
jgi:hypothetical protein